MKEHKKDELNKASHKYTQKKVKGKTKILGGIINGWRITYFSI